MTDKQPTIDEVLQRLYQSGREEEWSGHPSSENTTKADAKAQLEQLMARERIDELKRIDTRRHYGKDYEESLDELDDYVDNRTAQLELQSKQQEGEQL